MLNRKLFAPTPPQPTHLIAVILNRSGEKRRMWTDFRQGSGNLILAPQSGHMCASKRPKESAKPKNEKYILQHLIERCFDQLIIGPFTTPVALYSAGVANMIRQPRLCSAAV